MSKFREGIISNSEKNFLYKALAEGKRLDGRAFDEFRSLNIRFGPDWGCCYVSLGETKVIAQVSCQIQQAKSSRPSEGILFINVELSALAAPHFEAGRQTDLSVLVNRQLEKCIKDSKAVDLESLCIKMSEKVWALRVDVNVLNHEGNIVDCASIAALAALAHFRRPDVTCDGEEFIIHTPQQRDLIPTVIHHYPICVTYAVYKGEEYLLTDPSLLEENVADALLTIGINSYRELCGLHLGGIAELTTSTILRATKKAANRAAIVTDQIKKVLEEDNKAREENALPELFESANIQDNVTIDLEQCLDRWVSKSEKKRWKKKKKADREEEEEEEEQQSVIIEDLGNGSAALIPTPVGESAGWMTISTDEEDEVEEKRDDVIIVEQTKKTETVEIIDTDSEEDEVIILNEDNKRNRKKKQY